MGFRRDHITSNVESIGTIEEILEQSGEQYALEDLRYLEGRDTAARAQLINNWLDQQILWYEKMPTLLQRVENSIDTKITPPDLLQYLNDHETFLKSDISNTLSLTDTLFLNEKDKILQALLKLDKKRGKILREINSNIPELSVFLQKEQRTRLLEEGKLISEIPSEEK